jgi:hypothetical protein
MNQLDFENKLRANNDYHRLSVRVINHGLALKIIGGISLVSLLAMIILSCTRDPIRSSSTNNPNFQVSLLFKHDGIKVYRFNDGGHNVYFTNACGMTKYTTGGNIPENIESHSETGE